MKGGKGGRKRPANAPPDPARNEKGPSRGASKKDWGAIERVDAEIRPATPIPDKPRPR